MCQMTHLIAESIRRESKKTPPPSLFVEDEK